MAKMNLFGKGWTNIVFEGRNKAYGAYKLREESPRTTMMALLLGIVCVGLTFGGSAAFTAVFGERIDRTSDEDGIEVLDIEFPELPEPIEEIPIEEEPIIEPPQPEADASRSVQEEKKFTEMDVKEDEQVKKEDITSQEEFTDEIQSGRETSEADPDGEFKTEGQQTGKADPGSVGTGKGDNFSDEENKVYNFVSQKAVPNEGLERFYRNYGNRFNAPDISGNVNEISLRLRFVVEKDGSFTDIKVVGPDPHGAGREAMRVLRSMPKWKPAQHNGKTVRSSFTLPIKIRVNN